MDWELSEKGYRRTDSDHPGMDDGAAGIRNVLVMLCMSRVLSVCRGVSTGRRADERKLLCIPQERIQPSQRALRRGNDDVVAIQVVADINM